MTDMEIEGNLCKVTNHLSGKTYELDYDFLDRLMRVRDEHGACYEYTYDKNNQMTKMFHTDGKTKMTTTYAYDKDGRETEVMVPDVLSRFTDYDRLGRVIYQNTAIFSDDDVPGVSVYYEYPSADGNQERVLPAAVRMLGRLYDYEYDKNGNITEIKRTPQEGMGESSVKDTFQYVERNQLIRENSQTQNKTITYAYDQGGNLLSVKEYAYTEGTLPETSLRTKSGTYSSTYSSTWKDQLLNWNGITMTYDAVGNMLTRGDTAYTWTMGRKLAGVDNGKKIQYFYDHTGARVKKVVDGAVTEYHMAGDLIASETSNGKTMWYIYDSGANLLVVNIDGKYYIYVRNIQNDIIALVDASGKAVVNYAYDSWGKLLSITGNLKDTVGVQNPFRYRGYYYDNETGMYYLRNRYYDPELRRFISADKYVIGTDSILPNMYMYCGNNPVNNHDENGHLFKKFIAAVKKIGKSIKRAVRHICTVVTSTVKKIVGVQVKSSNTVKRTTRIWGLGSVSVSNTTSYFKTAGKAKPVTFYSGITKSDSKSYGREKGMLVDAQIASVGLSGDFSADSVAIKQDIGIGNSSLGLGVHWNYAEWSLGIDISSSFKKDNVESETTVSVDIGFPALVFALAVTAGTNLPLAAGGAVAAGIAIFNM